MNSVTTRTLPFEGVLEDVSGGNNKVQKSDYLPAGIYPIVDQGQEFVGGYTNESSNLVDGLGPWIVFGDHTRALKFVEFPFCMGADGVKVLKPRSGLAVDAKFLFHFLKANEVPSAGYSRHYKFLKRLEIPLPPLDEQRRIAAILDKAEALRRKRRYTIELLDSLAQSIFLDMFGDPIEDPRYPTCRLNDLVDSDRGISYGIVQRGEDQEAGVKVLRISDIVDGHITGQGLKQTSREIADKFRRTKLKGSEIVISIRGTVGRCAVVPNSLQGANVSREVAVIPTTTSRLNPFYLSLIRTNSAQRRLARDVKGVAQSGINLEDLRELPIILPSQSEVEKFLSAQCRFQHLELKSREHSDSLELLFSSLQERFFRPALRQG